ncbi:ATP-dependent DNA helicase PcrA, partial [bacterium]
MPSLNYNILAMDDYLSELNKEQKEAVIYGKGPLLILAGAGSGKTRVLTYRTAYLIQKMKIDPRKIALLTFTNKAAEEMKQRIKKLGEKTGELGFAGTFHTFCAKLLREYGINAGVNPNYVIFDSDDSEATMKKVLKEMEIDPKEYKPVMFLSIISRMKNDLVSMAEAEATAKDYFRRTVVKVWKAYQDKLKKNNAVDFDDLLVKAVALLKINRIREEINERLEWILVDEYQDTNRAQFELTKQLAGSKQNITAVGDAAQAIYSFRGADYRNLVLFETEYPKAALVSLPMNYRSTQNILDTAYGVISHNTTHPTLHLETAVGAGEMVDFFEAVDERDEARYIVEQGRKIAEENGAVAVLYRTNAQSRAFEDELMRRDIPYKLVGGLRFYNRAEIKDLVAYLRIVQNSEEEIAKARIEKMGKRRAEVFYQWLGRLSPDRKQDNPGQLLEEIINTVGFLERYDERDEDDVARIENINELLAVASEFKTVEKFLESAALSESEIRQHRSNAKITLMTAHAAKGLEFDNVFVVGLEEGLFPHSRSMLSGEKEEIEEERRLMYVAMTRAKKKLTLCFARHRLVFGGRHSSIPSRFLSEIPEKLLKKIGGVREVERKTVCLPIGMAKIAVSTDEFGEKKRIIVQDWEIEVETKADFE